MTMETDKKSTKELTQHELNAANKAKCAAKDCKFCVREVPEAKIGKCTAPRKTKRTCSVYKYLKKKGLI